MNKCKNCGIETINEFCNINCENEYRYSVVGNNIESHKTRFLKFEERMKNLLDDFDIDEKIKYDIISFVSKYTDLIKSLK